MPQFIPLDTQLNFEKRVLSPSQYPVLDNGDGTHSTHSMAWGEMDGGFVAYPTVIQIGDKLERLDDAPAFHHAIESGEFRRFTTPEDAEAYANGGYKQQWGALEKAK